MSSEVDMNSNQTKRPNPRYTLEFKQDAAKLVNEKGYAHQQAADNLGISLRAIGRWSRAGRGPATTSTTKTAALNLTGQAGLLRLRKEDGQLRMGRETIKKAAPFFAKETG
jgi:transposase